MKQNLVEAIKSGMNAAVKNLHSTKRGTCVADGCSNDALAKGFCNAHYLRSKKGLDMKKPLQAKTDVCVDCGGALNSKGGWMRCSKHFKVARQRTIKEALVDAMGGCCQAKEGESMQGSEGGCCQKPQQEAHAAPSHGGGCCRQ